MSAKESSPREENEPRLDGLAALRAYWKQDILSGFLVFLIALPLCLGISMASGFPPVAGLLTAIVGGLIATFLGHSPITIKGPAAGLIVIAIGAVTELGGDDLALGYRRTLAVGVAAAVIQIGFALLKAGKLGDFFPSSVVHGMLAAIGVIIFSKQSHTLLGVSAAGEPFELLGEIPHSLMNLNPEIALIGAISLVILFGVPALPFKFAKRIPAPMIVVVTAIGLGAYFNLPHEHTYSLSGHDYTVGPNFLVRLPGTLIQAVAFPDFSAFFTVASIKYVIMFSLVGSIESLLSAKAVDMLDPQPRNADLDKDLLAVGIGNLIAASIGGLPMISEIVRSKANLDNGARSRFSNFFHGFFLLAFVALAPWLLTRIPLSALAAMLIYTGLRLASPMEFVKTWKIGPEQLALFVFTLVVTLSTDLLIGVASGIALKLVLHVLRGVPLARLFSAKVEEVREGDNVVVRVVDAAIFSNYLGLKKRLAAITGANVTVDLSATKLVDHTVMEHLHDMVRAGRLAKVSGLDEHRPASEHELAARRKTMASQS